MEAACKINDSADDLTARIIGWGATPEAAYADWWGRC